MKQDNKKINDLLKNKKKAINDLEKNKKFMNYLIKQFLH